MPDTTLELSAVRRVATRAGALRFNKAVGQIIGSEASDDSTAERSATLTKLLSIYNRMRAAKMYGQEDAFKRASAEMADAIGDYSKKHPGGADRLRNVVKSLTFNEEAKEQIKAKNAAQAAPKK